MFDFKFPSEGLTLLHNRTASKDRNNKELPHVIQLNLVESQTKDILRTIRNNEQVRLKLGKKPLFQYGRKQLSLSHVDDTFPSEVFIGPLDGSEPVYFSGKLSHTLEVQKAKQDTAKTDEALAALENTLKSLKEQQASNEASFMGSKNGLKKKDNGPATLSSHDRLRGTATPSSPFLGASPRLGPTSNPLLSSTPSKDKIRLDAMRIPLVHLLAMGPMTAKAIATKLNVDQPDCDKVIDKIAKDGNGGNKELKDKCFRELDVWKFPYRSKEDRDAAIDRAIHAYDRMRVDKNDQLWQLLLPNEERGKGKILSRLNFNEKPVPAPTPKVGVDGEARAEAASDKESKAKKVKTTTEPKTTTHKKKLSGDSVVRKKIDKAPMKPVVQPAKVDGKFKSSERIEDSDEEAEGVEVIPAKPKALKPTQRTLKVAPSPKPPTASHTNGQHRHKLSSSSSGSNDLDRSRLQDERAKLKPRPKPERSPNTSRMSPRPRVDSSPQKPSPLGSSPPTNSTDLENSSKGSTQSSAPSSPPSSTDMPLSQTRKNYSPVIAGKSRNVSNQIKRKAEKGGEPPKKRQQIHGLGLPKTLTEKIQQQPTPERRPSDSSMSSPERPVITRESVVEKTMKFREYYASYKDLHVKLAQQEPDNRSDVEIDQLHKMHERLEKIKSELWSDWEKAGGDTPM